MSRSYWALFEFCQSVVLAVTVKMLDYNLVTVLRAVKKYKYIKGLIFAYNLSLRKIMTDLTELVRHSKFTSSTCIYVI